MPSGEEGKEEAGRCRFVPTAFSKLSLLLLDKRGKVAEEEEDSEALAPSGIEDNEDGGSCGVGELSGESQIMTTALLTGPGGS